MNWFLPRMLFAAFMAAFGAVAGTAIGWGGDAVLALTVVGAAMGASASAFIDRMKGYRLMRWVRDGHQGSAPRDAAFWGEMAYRIERALTYGERAVEAERAAARDFLAAIEASPNGVLLLDARDQIEWCNAVAATHLGLDPVRDRQQRVTHLVRDPRFVAFLQDAERDSAGIEFESRGIALHVLIRDYGPAKKLLLSQDVTERQRADAMRRDFVANVSHEIRTPLTVLSGFVETMSTLPLSDTERGRVLELMAQQTSRMQALVADLLTLAQLEGSPRPPVDIWVPVHDLLTDAYSQAVSLSAGRHAIEVDWGEPAALAGGDHELHSALGNLLTNAVRYTPSGGHISVAWRIRQDGSGIFSVRDTGPGIAREHLARLTERFYRVDGSRSRETGGTGLGLAIVKHVMQRHGGEIDIASEVGQGSTFRLVFPPVRVRPAPRGSTGSSDSTAVDTAVD
jgi:two-component system, OmpR family, phosphate regulon sensor histidine kinase PhoR